MSKEWLITFRSVTLAQKGERILKRAEIICTLQRTPKSLSDRGCGYCLRVRSRDGTQSVALLQSNQVPYGKIYTLGENDLPQEYAP